MKTDHVGVFEIGRANDHVHILLKLPPMIALSKLIGTIKSYSTKWLKNVKEQDLQFSWQDGYAAFSVDPGKLGAVQKTRSSLWLKKHFASYQSFEWQNESMGSGAFP